VIDFKNARWKHEITSLDSGDLQVVTSYYIPGWNIIPHIIFQAGI